MRQGEKSEIRSHELRNPKSEPRPLLLRISAFGASDFGAQRRRISGSRALHHWGLQARPGAAGAWRVYCRFRQRSKDATMFSTPFSARSLEPTPWAAALTAGSPVAVRIAWASFSAVSDA